MTKIKEKLLLALKDQDTVKELEKFGITSDLIEGFEELEKPANFDEALKQFNLQSDFDSRIQKALKTREDNLKAKYNFVDKEQPKDKEDPKTDNPEIAALLQKFSELEKKLEEQEKEKTQMTIQQKKDQFAKLLESENIPAIYVSVFDPEKDLDEQLPAIKERFTKEFPEATKSKGFKLPNPNRGDDPKPPKSEEEIFNNQF